MQCAQFKRKTMMEASTQYYVWLNSILETYNAFERGGKALEECWVAIIEQVYEQQPQGRLLMWEKQRKLFY